MAGSPLKSGIFAGGHDDGKDGSLGQQPASSPRDLAAPFRATISSPDSSFRLSFFSLAVCLRESRSRLLAAERLFSFPSRRRRRLPKYRCWPTRRRPGDKHAAGQVRRGRPEEGEQHRHLGRRPLFCFCGRFVPHCITAMSK
ncbi:hypothetical protein ABW21_db0209052 [Orbilia brochopaga]|nr:hypothetical protein ABW21_db0209052 [Drechslerella brochopaga]